MPEVSYSLDATTRLATLTIDTAGPVNTIGAGFVTDLGRAWRHAERDGVRGVFIRSGKPRSFLDGANLMEISHASAEEVAFLLERYQAVLQEMAASHIPVIGIVESATALGGGFELLLWACDHVFATSKSRLGLPEVNVGLFPAGGGTHTLPRAIGLDRALELMSAGKILPAQAFEEFGFLTVADNDALHTAGQWIDDHPVSANRNLAAPAADDESRERMRSLIARYRRELMIAECRPWFAALLDSIEEGLDRTVAEAARTDIPRFVTLLQSPNTHNAIDFFFLNTVFAPRLARIEPTLARDIDRIAVIGGGLMGRGIAQVAADSGLDVLLFDVDQDHVDAAVARIARDLDRLVEKGRWSARRRDALLERIHPSLEYTALDGVGLVIEAVFEDLDLKRQILARVQAANPEVLFASNTSTIPISMIAADADRPGQVVGMHFFSPVPLMKLLEVIRGDATSEEAVATAVTIGRRIGKTCIMVNDGPGFYTSRTFGTYVLTGIVLTELGMPPVEVDRIALEAGFPQGPLHVYGTAGGAVIYHAGKFMASQLPNQRLPKTLENLYNAGYTGAGKPCFYKDAAGRELDESVLDFIDHRDGPTPTPGDARDMLLLGMVNEAFRCLEEGIVNDTATLDLGAVLGIGFPHCWHGPARYAGQRGLKACRKRLAELHDRYGEPQLEPCRELDRLIAMGVDGGLV
ncbi:MAG: hypothetical protein GXP48_00985 [Acidobacteria bacterium]|nr:hypothetical protein [Acidobacteriota bacterium]